MDKASADRLYDLLDAWQTTPDKKRPMDYRASAEPGMGWWALHVWVINRLDEIDQWIEATEDDRLASSWRSARKELQTGLFGPQHALFQPAPGIWKHYSESAVSTAHWAALRIAVRDDDGQVRVDTPELREIAKALTDLHEMILASPLSSEIKSYLIGVLRNAADVISDFRVGNLINLTALVDQVGGATDRLLPEEMAKRAARPLQRMRKGLSDLSRHPMAVAALQKVLDAPPELPPGIGGG